MKKISVWTLLAVLGAVHFGALPVRADDDVAIGKNLRLGMGYKLWINSWQTNISNIPYLAPANFNQGGANFESINGAGVASIPNLSLRYKNFLLAGSYLATGNYNFGTYTDVVNYNSGALAGATESDSWIASRNELDINAGYYVHPNILLTVGYKGVFQKYTETVSARTITGAPVTFSGQPSTTGASKTSMGGVTFGIAGSAPIGAGVSLYGSGAGGFLSVGYTGVAQHDTAAYEAAELGIAWKPRAAPLSLSFGYKYQIIDTKTNTTSNPNNTGYVGFGQHGLDVTRGYILGLTFIF